MPWNSWVAMKKQEQTRSAKVDLGQAYSEKIELKASNLARNEEIPKLIRFIENELKNQNPAVSREFQLNMACACFFLDFCVDLRFKMFQVDT